MLSVWLVWTVLSWKFIYSLHLRKSINPTKVKYTAGRNGNLKNCWFPSDRLENNELKSAAITSVSDCKGKHWIEICSHYVCQWLQRLEGKFSTRGLTCLGFSFPSSATVLHQFCCKFRCFSWEATDQAEVTCLHKQRPQGTPDPNWNAAELQLDGCALNEQTDLPPSRSRSMDICRFTNHSHVVFVSILCNIFTNLCVCYMYINVTCTSSYLCWHHIYWSVVTIERLRPCSKTPCWNCLELSYACVPQQAAHQQETTDLGKPRNYRVSQRTWLSQFIV